MLSPSLLGEKSMYAVIESGGKQYRVAAGDTLEIDRVEAEVGQPVRLDRVLFAENEGKFSVGTPIIDNALIMAEIVEHFRGPKKVTFKMKRRKGYHKKIGHRHLGFCLQCHSRSVAIRPAEKVVFGTRVPDGDCSWRGELRQRRAST